MGQKVRCKKCGDIIESTYRWDYVSCKCGSITIDGGNDYTKLSWPEGDMGDWIEEIKENKNE